MAWEARKPGGSKYYTRTRKVRGRYIREYVGRGARAEAAAATDALQRAERQARAQERRGEQERLERAEEQLLYLDGALELLVHATLTAYGYHRHAKGEWRKRHGSSSKCQTS